MQQSNFGTQHAMITNTLSRYAWAYDMNEMDLMNQCFAREARVIFPSGPQCGREAVVGELRRMRASYGPQQTPWHVISNVFVQTLTPNEAAVKSWFSFDIKDKGEPMELNSFGWYDDIFVAEDGDWRVSTRRVLANDQR